MSDLFDWKAKNYVRLNRKRHKPGATLTLSKEDVEKHELESALELVGPASEGQNSNEPDSALVQSQQLDKLVEVIGQLDKDNESLWTSSGKPSVDALQGLVDFDISASSRDAAWTLLNAPGGE